MIISFTSALAFVLICVQVCYHRIGWKTQTELTKYNVEYEKPGICFSLISILFIIPPVFSFLIYGV